MAALASVDSFHDWLQQGPMTDGSWAREGALHLRIQDHATPVKAVNYLKVCDAVVATVVCMFAGVVHGTSRCAMLSRQQSYACMQVSCMAEGQAGQGGVRQAAAAAVCRCAFKRTFKCAFTAPSPLPLLLPLACFLCLQLGPGDVSMCAIVPRDSSSKSTIERNPLVGDPFCHQQHRVQVGA